MKCRPSPGEKKSCLNITGVSGLFHWKDQHSRAASHFSRRGTQEDAQATVPELRDRLSGIPHVCTLPAYAFTAAYQGLTFEDVTWKPPPPICAGTGRRRRGKF